MGRHRVWVAAVVAIAATACTGRVAPNPTASPSSLRLEHVGSLVFGAEFWAECLNPINDCSASTWTWYSILEHVLPRAMQLDPKGAFVDSPLLREAPSVEHGGITQNPFSITYKISNKAVWADGSPISSKDFRFTWRAILS